VRELLPSTSRAWAALAAITAVVAAVSFGLSDAAGITAVGIVAGLALLNIGRVSRWVEPRRITAAAEQVQRSHTRELRQSLDALNADLDAARADLTRIAEQMSSLRLTVSQAASTIAGRSGDQS